MSEFLTKPTAAFSPARGLLHTELFQMAYATNDIDRACDMFRKRFGIREFRRLEGQLPAGGYMRLELAWVGTIMYELLTATGAGSDLYVGRLTRGEFSTRHHHLGFLIHNEVQWQELMIEIKQNNWNMVYKSSSPGFLQSCFVDVPELGHYFEYIFPEPAGVAFFEDVPAS